MANNPAQTDLEEFIAAATADNVSAKTFTEQELFNRRHLDLSNQYFDGCISFAEFAHAMMDLLVQTSVRSGDLNNMNILNEKLEGDAAKQTAYKTYQKMQAEADQMFTVWLRA